ncbi:MAG TPA: RecX family transcriptional regulator [Candidatus Dormibacteraeota bacterium]|nr:RecX family transcriptional regulator [Candidatus Dormibacteraeota bacterium]
MKITEIRPQIKRTDRFSIFIDDKYSFSLSSKELLEAKLYVGLEISDIELVGFNKLAENSLVRAQCFRYLSYRLRSEWEMETYLKRKGYSPELIKDTIDYFVARKLIDDQEFANRWIENRLLLKPTSINVLKQELKQKRVKGEVINQAVIEHNIDELQIIKQLIEKKRQQSKYQDDLKLMQLLARKGFSYDHIKRSLNSAGD